MSKLSSTDVIRQALRDKLDREVNKAIYVDEIKKNIIFALFFLCRLQYQMQHFERNREKHKI